MDLSRVFNDALERHKRPPIEPHVLGLDGVEAFLMEAYRISSLTIARNTHIRELQRYLRAIRQPYLSATPALRRSQHPRASSSSLIRGHGTDRKQLTDVQREQIDAESKQLLRELASAIKSLGDAERVRQSAAETIALRERARQGLGALGRWAAGGASAARSTEEEAQQSKQNMIKIHRDGVVWYLSRALEHVGGIQASMMEVRLEREREKSKSVLHKTRGAMIPPTHSATGLSGGIGGQPDAGGENGQQAARPPSEEQLQLLAEENRDMLKHYEHTLDKVRTTERSILEISELQSTLAANLSGQEAQIDQLVHDSQLTADNVGSGNKELRRAAERRSVAQAIFYATCAMCGTLVLWDLLI